MFTKLRMILLAGLALILVQACVPAPTSVSLNIVTSGDSNNGSPVKVTVYYLRSLAKFNSTDYFTLAAGAQAALGADLVKTSYALLSPKDVRQLSASFDGEGPAAVGVVVGFQAIASSQWRTTSTLKQGAANLLTVNVGKGSVSVSKQ